MSALRVMDRRTEWVGDEGFCVEWVVRSGVWHAYRWVTRRNHDLIEHVGIADDLGAAIRMVQR